MCVRGNGSMKYEPDEKPSRDFDKLPSINYKYFRITFPLLSNFPKLLSVCGL